MADFEKLYGEVLIAPEESPIVSLESVVAALTEVALEVKDGEEVILVGKDGAIFRKQDDGAFHLEPKKDYVIMRSTYRLYVDEAHKPCLCPICVGPRLYAFCVHLSAPTMHD